MAEIFDIVGVLIQLLLLNVLGFMPLILPLFLACAVWGWFTGRGPLGRARVERAASAAVATASAAVTLVGHAVERGVAFARSPGAVAVRNAARPVLPYVIAAAVGLALFVLFPILLFLAFCAYCLWSRRVYDLLLAILGLATLVMANTEALTAIMFMTFGFGFPLIFVGTVFAYALCARPAILALSGPPSRRVRGVVLSAVAMMALAVLPGFAGRTQAWLGARSLSANDHVPAKPPAPQSLEIRRPASSYDRTFEDTAACGPECRAVLSAGPVSWVRVVMLGSPDRSTAYRRSEAGECGRDTIGKLTLPPSCILTADDPGGVADLVLTFAVGNDLSVEPGLFVTWQPTRSVTATRREGGKAAEILRQTGADVEIPSIPAFIIGGQFARLTDTSHAVSLRGTLVTLGLVSATRLADATPPRRRTWDDSIDAGMNREVEAVLNLSQVAPFNADQARVISEWLSAARKVEDWAPDQLALLRRIALDQRIRVPTNFDQIFERNPKVTAALLPDILDLLDAHGVTDDYTSERQAAYTFARIDPVLLAPHAQRILALREKDSKLRALLLPAVGRLGVDPSPYLLPIGHDIASVRAVCVAEARWAPVLIPALRDAVSANERGPKSDAILRTAFEEAALKALAKMGDAEFVRQYLAPRDDADAKRLARWMHFELNGPLAKEALCWR